MSLIKTKPRLDAQLVREKTIQVRVTAREFEFIKVQAKLYNTTIAKLVRARLLGNYSG